MKDTFRDKTVIVTGASSGIGKAIALRLAGEGAWLALAARDAERLEALAGMCQERGGKAIAIPTDVGVEESCRALIRGTVAVYDQIDMLVNNAGIDVVSKLEDLPDLSLFKQVLNVNLYGAVYCTYYALPQLKANMGRIENISSLGGFLAIPHNTSYISSKFALIGFSDSLRMEVKPAGVSVTVICPALIETEFHERYMDKDGKPIGSAGRAIYTKRTMSADKCAQIVLRAARQRKRQLVMRPGTLARWLMLITPSLVDRLVVSAFLRPAVKRTQAYHSS